MTATLTALFRAAQAFFLAFPTALAWRINSEIEGIASDIIRHEKANTPADRIAADELRVRLAYRRRLHDALLAALPPPKSGGNGANG